VKNPCNLRNLWLRPAIPSCLGVFVANKNFLIFLNIPLDDTRICSRIAILDGQAMFIPRCLAIGVFTRHKLFFNKLTVMPNSSESAIAPASSFRKRQYRHDENCVGRICSPEPMCSGLFSTFDVCAK